MPPIMLSIGEFAQASRLSPKALRLYDELGLLEPAHVDPDTGYRWYEPGQLRQAYLVAALRRIGVPLVRIKQMTIAAEPGRAAHELLAFWADAESEHAAQRELVGHLARQLAGTDEKESRIMYQMGTREVPERKMLCLLRRMHQDEVMEQSRELFIRPLVRANPARIEGVDGAAFMIYHGEVSADSDGPVEWCRPVPDAEAEQIAEQFPQYQLRTEAGHREAFVCQPSPGAWATPTGAELALDALREWATERGLQANGGIRMVLIHNPANGDAGPDLQFAVPVRAAD